MNKQFQVALFRGLLTGILLGASATLAIWSQTDDGKTLAIAGLTPFIGALLTRFAAEGFIDTAGKP